MFMKTKCEVNESNGIGIGSTSKNFQTLLDLVQKKGTGNKVSIIKKPCIREPPQFNELPREEQLRLNENAAGFRDVGYFVIHDIRLPLGTLEEVPNEDFHSNEYLW